MTDHHADYAFEQLPDPLQQQWDTLVDAHRTLQAKTGSWPEELLGFERLRLLVAAAELAPTETFRRRARQIGERAVDNSPLLRTFQQERDDPLQAREQLMTDDEAAGRIEELRVSTPLGDSALAAALGTLKVHTYGQLHSFLASDFDVRTVARPLTADFRERAVILDRFTVVPYVRDARRDVTVADGRTISQGDMRRIMTTHFLERLQAEPDGSLPAAEVRDIYISYTGTAHFFHSLRYWWRHTLRFAGAPLIKELGVYDDGQYQLNPLFVLDLKTYGTDYMLNVNKAGPTPVY